ncbi:MAG: protein kinase, partial [Pirellulaceae bacterium]
MPGIDEQARERFEQAWLADRPLDVADCAPPATDSRHLETLEELVLIELEFAWKRWKNPSRRGEPASPPLAVEHYLEQFPQLRQPQIVRRLIKQEQRVRRQHGESVGDIDLRTRLTRIGFGEDDETLAPSVSDASFSAPGIHGGRRDGLSAQQFVEYLTASGLLSAETCQQIRARIAQQRSISVEDISRQLAVAGQLTPWQVERLLEGQTRFTLGKYTLLDELGQGGMGTVYKAHHAALDRIVAIKVMRLVKEPRAVTRFRREIRAAARLVHPNIVHATDADEANGTHYLVMEFVEGTDLAAYVRERGPLSVETAIQFLLQAAQGLEHAHQRGVVHRDMKPSNLLLDRDGTVKVLDMGLARLDSADGEQDQLTGTGQVMGTVDFMAPEQAQNTKQADARVDIYSLGVTLWYLLTGRILYSGDSVLSKLLAHQRDPIPSLHEACPQASRELERVFTKMVAKSPDDRYCSMSTVIADLRSCLTALSPSPVRQASDFPTAQNQHVALSIRPAVGARRLRHPPKRPTSIVLALGVAGLLLVAATIIIKITLPDGTTTEIRVADGSKIEIIGEQGPKVAKTGDRPTPQGGIEQGAAANYALEFDGVDDNVEIPGLELPELDEYTIEALIEPRDVPAHPGRGVIIALYGRNRANFDVRWSTTEEKLPSLYAMSSNGYVTTSSLGLPNRPTHLAFCRTREQMRLYLDGKSVVEKPIDATATQRGSGANPQPCRIGAFRDDSNALRWFFDGVIDEVRISKGIRYAADFTPALRHQPDANTVALYHFDEGTGDVLKDSSSYYRHGKVYGATWVPQSDPTGLPAASDPRRVAQWVLEHGANVVVTVKSPEPQSITISNPIGLPAGAFELTGLRLRFGSTDDQALEKLLALPFQWKRIYLTGTKVTDVTLRRLNSQT